MKSLIAIDEWVKKPKESYEYQYKLNFELILDISATVLEDTDYTEITKALKTIKSTLEPYRKKALESVEKETKDNE